MLLDSRSLAVTVHVKGLYKKHFQAVMLAKGDAKGDAQAFAHDNY